MKKVLAILLFLLPAAGVANTACEPHVDSCEFYLCQEQSHHCGPQGYPVGFGYKFCQVYLHGEENYSPQAQTWLRRVRVCLMQEFAAKERENSHRSCSEIKSSGFDSHVGCYVETGFCELSGADHLQIFWALRSSLRHAAIFADARDVAKACAARRAPSPEGLSAQR